jgi:stage V sporulation protein S
MITQTTNDRKPETMEAQQRARAANRATATALERSTMTEILKVSANSRPAAVAGAIAKVIRETGVAEVQAIGAGATNQAVKAVAIACSYLTEDAIKICCIPSFTNLVLNGEERTAMRFLVERR